MNAQELGKIVTENTNKKKELTDKLYRVKQKIEKEYYDKILSHNNILIEIEEKYRDFAVDLAIKTNKCPTDNRGQYIAKPTETTGE